MTTPMDEATRARLQLDLNELLDDPYPGIRIFPPKENNTEFCLVFTLSDGPWQGLNLHFKVSFSGRWPATPPTIQAIPSLDHPLLVDSYVVCRRFGPKHLPPGYTSLYAIPLRVLFIQLFGLFSDYRILCTTRKDELGAAIFGEPNGRYESNLIGERHCNSNFQGALYHQWRTNSGPGMELGHPPTEGESNIHSKGDKLISLDLQRNPVVRSSGSWRRAHHILSTFRCPSCPYGGDDLPHVDHDTQFPPAIGPGQEAVSINDEARPCHLEALNDDILGAIALHMSTECLRHFAVAYPRFSWVVTSTRLIPRRELSCVFLRRPIRDVILGIIVTMRFSTHTVVSSNYEWFSKEAVEDHNAGGPYFLPLAFEPRHFKRAEGQIWASIDTINSAILSMYQACSEHSKTKDWRWMGWAAEQLETGKMTSGEPSLRSQRSMSALFWMMEGTVESLFGACGKDLKHATQRTKPLNKFVLRSASQADAAIVSYGLLLHLLLCLYRSEPELLRQAANQVRTAGGSGRKTSLDEYLILTMILNILPPVNTHNPTDLSLAIDAYLGATIRDTNSTPGLASPLSEMKTEENAPGMWAAFCNNQIKFQKIMFHVSFSRTFQQFYPGETGLFKLDDNFGFLEDRITNKMARRVEEICQVKSLSQFLHFIDFAKGL